jgi:hypothetical protein
MASFVHITDEKCTKRIAATGIAMSRTKGKARGVFCFPVLNDFAVSHQWARELKRSGVKVQVCVQFRVPDDESVLIGKYNGEKITMSAAEAVSTAMLHTAPFGLEIVIPRKVTPDKVMRVYPAPRLIGWRYYPEAKGKKPFCHCKYCNRGEINAQRLIRDEGGR